jgi:hypothetical protein
MTSNDNMSNPSSNGYEKLNSEIENLKDLNITTVQAKKILYPFLEKIINLSDEEKYHIFKEWKYGVSLELTIKTHTNNRRLNTCVPWEESFCMSFLLYVYH